MAPILCRILWASLKVFTTSQDLTESEAFDVHNDWESCGRAWGGGMAAAVGPKEAEEMALRIRPKGASTTNLRQPTTMGGVGNLRGQRRLASDVLGVGKRKVSSLYIGQRAACSAKGQARQNSNSKISARQHSDSLFSPSNCHL